MIYLVKTLQPFSWRFMALFLCLYRNIKGLSAVLFVLCHPVDLLAFHQKEKISFYMLLQSSKRWYTVITDRRLSRAKGRRKPSLFFALFCFFLPGRELKEHLMWILWGNKDQKSCTQIKMQMCSSVLLCCQHKNPKALEILGEQGHPQGTRAGSARAHLQGVPSGCPHTLKQTSNHSTWKCLFCELGLKTSWEPRELGKFSILPVLPCSIMLLLPIHSLQKTHLFYPKAVFQTPGSLQVTWMNCEVLCEDSFFLLQTNWWKIQRWVEQAQKWMDTGTVRWKLSGVGTRLGGNKFERCVWVPASSRSQSPAVNVIPVTSDSLGKQRSEVTSVLGTRIAASGTSDINDIAVFIWFKTPTFAKEASAGVTNCNWGYWSRASCKQWELLSHSSGSEDIGSSWPQPQMIPQGWHRQGAAQLHCLTRAGPQQGHLSISDSNPRGTVMSPCQHIPLTPSTSSSFPSDYFQPLWDCFQRR